MIRAGIDAINVPDGPRASARMSAQVTCQKIQEAADFPVYKIKVGLASDEATLAAVRAARAAGATVSVDLMVRSLLKLGAKPRDIARAIA